VTLSLLFAFASLCISCVTLWKTHFARFGPLAIAGNLTHRIYPIRSGTDRWFITSFDIPISVTNPGARPGCVDALRLRLHYPDLPFAGNHEFIYPKWELKPDKLNSIDKDRFGWIDEVVAADWSPFVVLPKATVAKHFLYEERWDTPVVQKRIVATLELHIAGRTDWISVSEWKLTVGPHTWVDLETGTAMVYQPEKTQLAGEIGCSPTDLHKYTGTKATLPAKGALSGMEPSHVDYPESED